MVTYWTVELPFSVSTQVDKPSPLKVNQQCADLSSVLVFGPNQHVIHQLEFLLFLTVLAWLG